MQSHRHTAVSRHWKDHQRSSQQQRLLRILWGRNPMRWDLGRFTSLNLPDVQIGSEIVWKHRKRHSNKNRLRRGHCERSSNPGSICSFYGPSSVPERGHWSCTEDYSNMRGSLNFAFKSCKMIDQSIDQEASEVEPKVKELQARVGNLMIIIVDHVRRR